MGVILPGVERDGIFPQFFHGIGTGRDYFLWEWDGRGLKNSLPCHPLVHTKNENYKDNDSRGLMDSESDL